MLNCKNLSTFRLVTLALIALLGSHLASEPLWAQKKPATPSYAIIPLSEAAGLVYGINAPGEMVGRLSPSGLPEATHWSFNNQGGVITTTLDSTVTIGVAPGALVKLDSVAGGINDDGIIVGDLSDYATGREGRPVVWMNALAAPQVLSVPLPNPPAVRVVGGAFAVSNLPTGFTGLKAVVVGRYIEYFDNLIPSEAPTVTHVVAWGITTDDQFTGAFELGSAAGPA